MSDTNGAGSLPGGGPVQDDAWVDQSVQKMLGTIEKNEVIAAILTLTVQREIRKYFIAVVSLLGAGTITALLTLPSYAVGTASKLLEEQLAGQLLVVNNKVRAAEAAADSAGDTTRKLDVATGNFRARAEIIRSNLTASELLMTDIDKEVGPLKPRALAIKADLDAAQPVADRFKSGDLKAIYDQLTPDAVAKLQAVLNATPAGTLLLTRDRCPKGWAEDDAAQGAVLTGASSPEATARSVSWFMPVVKANLPEASISGSVDGSNATLSLPEATILGTPRASHPLQFVTCTSLCGAKNFRGIAAAFAPLTVRGTIDGAQHKPLDLGRRYTIHVCKIAA